MENALAPNLRVQLVGIPSFTALKPWRKSWLKCPIRLPYPGILYPWKAPLDFRAKPEPMERRRAVHMLNQTHQDAGSISGMGHVSAVAGGGGLVQLHTAQAQRQLPSPDHDD